MMMAAESTGPRPPWTSCGRAGEVAVGARFRPGGMQSPAQGSCWVCGRWQHCAVKGMPCGLLCSGRCGTWRWRMSGMPGSSGMMMWWSGSLPAHCAALIFICMRVVLARRPGWCWATRGWGSSRLSAPRCTASGAVIGWCCRRTSTAVCASTAPVGTAPRACGYIRGMRAVRMPCRGWARSGRYRRIRAHARPPVHRAPARPDHQRQGPAQPGRHPPRIAGPGP
jgi:hypothetical protein